MADSPRNVGAVQVNRIFLHLANPRHDPVAGEAQAIQRLCDKEGIYPLAKDIANHGLNPLEILALVPSAHGGGKTDRPTYFVAEGNRRICALKLLNDPDLAPASLRKQFEKLAAKWTPVKTVPGVVFGSLQDVRLWLGRIHNGYQGGIGRKEWNAEQKTRFSGDKKNGLAQSLLDYAESEKWITADERAGKLTTAQRFLSNVVFRETLGIDQSDPNEVQRTRPKGEFDVLAKKFVRDLVGNKDVTSRMNQDAIVKYARPMNSLPGVSSKRIDAEPIDADEKIIPAKNTGRNKPPKTGQVKYVTYDDDVDQALMGLKVDKLISLYRSIVGIELEQHTPIVSIGTWAFFETLTACAGRHDGTSFEAFLSKSKLGLYGFTGDTLSIRSALGRIKECGNTTKHHPVGAAFNGAQLNNDFAVLKPVILKCIGDAMPKAA